MKIRTVTVRDVSPADIEKKIKADGLTYASIAGKLGVSRPMVYRWLDGTRYISEEHYKQLREAVGL